jgi:hypothetical protein
MSATLTISHSAAEGTLITETSKGDGSIDALRAAGIRRWKWSRNIGSGGAWYLPQSRDRDPNLSTINASADALRRAGFIVELDIDDTARSTADVEADRRVRAAERAAALTGKAERLGEKSDQLYAAYRQKADAIPFGQPILVDHYSAGRDINYRKKMVRTAEKSFETAREAQETARRAESAATTQRHRENGATTERRIERLEAKLRGVERNIARPGYGTTTDVERWQRMATELTDQLTYWREHLAALVESGEYRKWTRADFRKGDQVQALGTWYPVLRVNAKTLTVSSIVGGTWTDTLPYDKVTGRRPAND